MTKQENKKFLKKAVLGELRPKVKAKGETTTLPPTTGTTGWI